MMTELFGMQFVANAASDTISDNLLLILFSLGLTITIIAVMTIIDQWSRYSSRTKLDELESKLQKLKRYAQYQKRKALKDSIAMLKPKEREHLYSLWEDNAVISRKALFKLNELEDRLRRSERGAELRWAESRIEDVRSAERKLFPESFNGTVKGRKVK
jgi:hypothetical protein